MDAEIIKKYIGKKVLIVLKNDFQYTAIIPYFEGKTFTITDKFGKNVDIDIDYVAFIREA